MKKITFALIQIIMTCVFVSCYSVPNITSDSQFSVQAKTGYLIFVVNIQGDPAGLILRVSLTRWLVPRIGEWYNLKPGKNIIFVKAPQGRYTLDMVFDRSLKRVFTDFELSNFTFTVENGVITYGGELVLELVESRNKHGNRVINFQYTYRDTYDEAVEYLRSNYPGIPDTVTILNDCPQIPEGKYFRPVIIEEK